MNTRRLSNDVYWFFFYVSKNIYRYNTPPCYYLREHVLTLSWLFFLQKDNENLPCVWYLANQQPQFYCWFCRNMIFRRYLLFRYHVRLLINTYLFIGRFLKNFKNVCPSHISYFKMYKSILIFKLQTDQVSSISISASLPFGY